MKILITGGAGYIGTELVHFLAKEKQVDEIVVYDNLSRANFNLFLNGKIPNYHKITFIQGELLDTRQLKKALVGVDIVYHLAAKVTTPFANTDPHFYEQVNHWGTAELVYALESSDVHKLIFTSSTSVYGSSKKPVDESVLVNPKTFYGISKMRGEEHVARLGDKMNTIILRCGNVYGYSQSMRFDAVINKFVFEANFNKKISIHGDGRQHRSFIHINQITAGLGRLAYTNLASGTYNFVVRDLNVLDVVDELKQQIPELEFIFVNQHLTLRELRVKVNEELNKLLGITHDKPFSDELNELRNQLSF